MATVTEPESTPLPSVPIVRRRLPDTRNSITHKFAVDQYEGYITVGFYEDGRPGEVFMKISKHGSTIAGLIDAIAVLISLALQYGVPVDALAPKFEFTRFEPAGRTKNPELRHVHSLVDYIFRWLGMTCSPEDRNGQAKQVLLTYEVSQPTSKALIKLPDAAREFNVECIPPYVTLRQLKVRFQLAK